MAKKGQITIAEEECFLKKVCHKSSTHFILLIAFSFLLPEIYP